METCFIERDKGTSALRPRSLINFGGKATIAPLVWSRLGDVPNLVDPFFGSGAVLLARPHPPQLETVNDLDGMICNFYRAVSAEPEEVAKWADQPVNECDLTARHIWLVNRKESLQERLEGDPDFYDAKIAGWWVWGMCCWIGSGWCSGKGPWQSVDGKITKVENGAGVNKQLPHLGDAGKGVNRKLPHLGNAGKGVNRKRPHLSGMGTWNGMGVLNSNIDIYEWFDRLSYRLRRVRVCCGDWKRVMGPSVTIKHGVTGVFCLHPETLIRTSDERLVRVDSIPVNEKLWGDRTVRRVMTRWHDGEMISLKIQGLPDALRVTPEHRILRIPKRTGKRQETRDDKTLWDLRKAVESRHLQVGDYLLVPMGGKESPASFCLDCDLQKKGSRQKHIEFNPSDDLFRMIGYYAAEGHVRYKRGVPQGTNFTFNKNEEHTYIKDLCEISKTVFGIMPTFRRHNRGCINVWIGSSPIAKFFSALVYGTATNKILHPDLMRCPAKHQFEILKGWARGDGGIHKTTRNRCKLNITSASEMLARQMFTIALRCGLKPSFKKRQNNFDIYFASQDAHKLGWVITAQKFRSSRRIINEHLLVRIREINNTNYTGLVYDIDVDGDNLFPAPYALVHNCDPPYSDMANRDPGLYASESLTVAHDVREWCLENGDNPLLRIALCGYVEEHQMPDSWECVAWKPSGGYSNMGDGQGKINRGRERTWFSPHCLKGQQVSLWS